VLVGEQVVAVAPRPGNSAVGPRSAARRAPSPSCRRLEVAEQDAEEVRPTRAAVSAKRRSVHGPCPGALRARPAPPRGTVTVTTRARRPCTSSTAGVSSPDPSSTTISSQPSKVWACTASMAGGGDGPRRGQPG
jgi:hypothetical protein